ncbi:S-layer homology domain-containing protein [uncultured Oscillibacter sp.]|uniref:S-layer homology domain-containing protein n=1 Tax=uncultured Oscillibacter sp. TaxID=876091 RepID=UPI001F8CA7A1|nr:S-layer homology domain-containing protein [uncultured Oscillibacter sp.]HJB77589.1 S-layer homology domain-containing protein [Candidatus Oscillibacter avistercoris]
MKRRIITFLLAVCMTVSLLAVPAGAASGATVTFSDIGDRSTAMAVESLRLLGVLDGYGDGTFRPGTVLNRAQFCKMAVYAMNGSSELSRYRTVTIFPDVKLSHWAAAYINMAAKGKDIISGYADGRFHPDRTVTVGQAVTILMRMLGYKDEDIGGIWPDSYMAEAATVGLTEGVSTNGSAGLTRAQAARLFLNLLRTQTKEGGTTFASTLGQTVQGVLLSADTEGGEGRLRLSTGTYTLTEGKASNGMLNGMKGTLIVDSKSGRALTFVPEDLGSSKTVVLASAKATEMTDTSGNTYTVKSDTQVFQNGEAGSWGEAYTWLNAGTSVTLYLDAAGNVDYVFVGGGGNATSAVIVYEKGSTAGFASLAGGATGYTIYKNGVRASSGDMRKYDVATYSAVTNSIRVSDTRITGYYEDCSPNPSEPSKITVLGHEFNVLPSAMQTVSKFRPGDQITLLLTEDNQVAGAVEATGTTASGNAIGIAEVSSGSATVNLLCGIQVKGSVKLSASDVERLNGQLVRVSSNKKDGLSLTRLTGGVSGDLDVENGKLGSRELAENVIIFQNDGSGLTAISLSQITEAKVPSSQITYAGTDWADRVKVIVLNSVTGSGYIFGRAHYTANYDEEGNRVGNAQLSVEYGEGKTTATFETGYVVRNGDIVGITIVTAGNTQRIGSLIYPDELRNVPNAAWSGKGAVTVNGRTYTVPASLPCYNRETKEWVTLTEARAYADSATLYVHQGVVRFLEVG